MKWKKHWTEKVAKGKWVDNMVKALERGRRGMRVEALRTMATARTIMEYGAGAWWAGRVGAADAFDKAHKQAFTKIGGLYRTAPGGGQLSAR